MLSPKLYQKSRTYDFFMKSLGFEHSIDRFLRHLKLPHETGCRILDAGCGTGLLGLHFLERIPESTLLATDLEPNFLQATLMNAERRGIDPRRITLGVADISSPGDVTELNGTVHSFCEGTFDLICMGAVVGYSQDTEESIRKLLRLLTPGGYLVNIEMNESLTGRFVSHRYHYRNISLARMQEVIREEGCDVTAMRFNVRHLPAKLTRAAVIAHKSAT
ncbi:MAG: class I SAM-dependent methyltransferase [Planctomycetaceae bacterium]|nr:class I SAM-dependent methyltransferase [Planctomycetaceae bacterium]